MTIWVTLMVLFVPSILQYRLVDVTSRPTLHVAKYRAFLTPKGDRLDAFDILQELTLSTQSMDSFVPAYRPPILIIPKEIIYSHRKGLFLNEISYKPRDWDSSGYALEIDESGGVDTLFNLDYSGGVAEIYITLLPAGSFVGALNCATVEKNTYLGVDQIKWSLNNPRTDEICFSVIRTPLQKLRPMIVWFYSITSFPVALISILVAAVSFLFLLVFRPIVVEIMAAWLRRVLHLPAKQGQKESGNIQARIALRKNHKRKV
jgi:hypothetical protein